MHPKSLSVTGVLQHVYISQTLASCVAQTTMVIATEFAPKFACEREPCAVARELVFKCQSLLFQSWKSSCVHCFWLSGFDELGHVENFSWSVLRFLVNSSAICATRKLLSYLEIVYQNLPFSELLAILCVSTQLKPCSPLDAWVV